MSYNKERTDMKKMTLGDYDIWYEKCGHCGYDSCKKAKPDPKCWKCGRKIHRDYSDRALKKAE